MTEVLWLSAFLDLAADEHEAGPRAVGAADRLPAVRDPRRRRRVRRPWCRRTATTSSASSGWARASSRVHLDVHVADPWAAAEDAVRLGAAVVADERDYLTLASPGGFTFCVVPHPARRRAARRPTGPTAPGPGSTRSASTSRRRRTTRSSRSGRTLTGWEARPPRPDVEFARLTPPAGQPLNLLLQRLDEDEPAVRAHLDWCATDRDAEVDRHVAAGVDVRASGSTAVGRC